jgi:hypothetical protein
MEVNTMKDRNTICIVWKIKNEKLSRMYRENCGSRTKFCSDGCRNAYNNKINKDSNICATQQQVAQKLSCSIRTWRKIKTTWANSLARVLILIFHQYIKTKTGNTYFFYDQGYMLLDNDFYMLSKKILNPTQFQIWKKVFPHFCRYIIAILAILFFTMMPQWTSDDGVLLSIFNWKALEK